MVGIPGFRDDDEYPAWPARPGQLPPITGLSETWWPTSRLEVALCGRMSRLPWRRRRAYRACQWLIVRRETVCGLRSPSVLEILMR